MELYLKVQCKAFSIRKRERERERDRERDRERLTGPRQRPKCKAKQIFPLNFFCFMADVSK